MSELNRSEQFLIEQSDRRVSKKVRANFELYLRSYEDFSFCGKDYSGDVRSHPEGVTALQAFNAVDSLGHNPMCREPEILARAWNGKAALNFQIKQWAQGLQDGLFCIAEFQEDYPYLPEWVWQAVWGQVYNYRGFRWYWEPLIRDKNEQKEVAGSNQRGTLGRGDVGADSP